MKKSGVLAVLCSAPLTNAFLCPLLNLTAKKQLLVCVLACDAPGKQQEHAPGAGLLACLLLEGMSWLCWVWQHILLCSTGTGVKVCPPVCVINSHSSAGGSGT